MIFIDKMQNSSINVTAIIVYLQKFSFHNNFYVGEKLLSYIYLVDPKSMLMQKAYLFFLLVFTLVLSGQEKLPAIDEKYQESSNFTLYPNPAIDGIVYIKTLNNRSKDITVYDVFGKIVLQDRISTNMLNIGRLSPGVYVIQVIENNKTMTRKLVVK